MKSLYLMRHAKSTWKEAMLSDFQRPLNSRGHVDARRMGKALGSYMDPLTFHVSSAKRAQLTFFNLRQEWEGLKAKHCVSVAELYTFDYLRLIQWISTQPSEIRRLALIGHNPALTNLINFLVGSETLDNLATAGFAELKLDILEWRDLPRSSGKGLLSSFIVPKDLPEV